MIGRLVRLVLLLTVMDSGQSAPTTAASNMKQHVTVSRHFQGDIFSHPGECIDAFCPNAGADLNGTAPRPLGGDSCQCQCQQDRPIFREDLQQCVETIEECTLAEYVRGELAEKVPFIFLPQKGQLINPTAEIALADVRVDGQPVISPVCVVSRAHISSADGWKPLENSTDSSLGEPPLALYRESGRTYLQVLHPSGSFEYFCQWNTRFFLEFLLWFGDIKQRAALEGRIGLVKLLCKDTANSRVGVFSPCIAFRVAGSPGFLESTLYGENSKSSGLRNIDYVAIGISAGLLGALYVAGLTAFLCYRRRKNRLSKPGKLQGSSKSPLLQEGQNRINPVAQTRARLMNDAVHNQQFLQDPTLGIQQEPLRRQTTMAVVHPMAANRLRNHDAGPDSISEHVLAETNGHPGMSYRDVGPLPMDQPDKRLFYSSAYIDPELLKSPPPGALEFLGKIRCMMGLARGKMATRRFMPSLIDIPEEYGYGSAAGSSQQLHKTTSQNYGSTTNSKSEKNDINHSKEKEPTESAYGSLRRGMASTISSLKNSVRRHFKNEEIEKDQIIQQTESDSSSNPSNQATPEPLATFSNQMASIYTNPSIDEIYNSLQRHDGSMTNHYAVKVVDDDDLNDILSEAESKVPKLYSSDSESCYSADTLQRSLDFEADSLDRLEYNRRKNAQKRLEEERRAKDDLKNSNEEQLGSEGYISSASTVKSLSCVLPRKEEVEVGNQLFNTNTGAKTLHKPLKQLPEVREDDLYEVVGNPGSFPPDITQSPGSPGSISSAYSVLTVVQSNQEPHNNANVDGYEEMRPEKLTIQLESSPASIISVNEDDTFDPDTLEKRPYAKIKRQESFTDSLERPTIQSRLLQNKLTLKASSARSEAYPNSLCGIYAAKRDLSLDMPKDISFPLKDSFPSLQVQEPPPRPPKTQRHVHNPPLLPRRDAKPAEDQVIPERPPKKGTAASSLRPSMPPKSCTEQTCQGNTTNLPDVKNHRNSLSVLQRIAEIESVAETTDGLTKGMEIALALRAKMDLEGSLRDGKRSLSIKKTWRKFIERVEDSFSEAETASSAASSLAGTLRLNAGKQKDRTLALPEERHFSSSESSSSSKTLETDSESPSLGSDGTGQVEITVHSELATLKGNFILSRQERKTPLYRQSGKRENGTMKRVISGSSNESFDSGLDSSNYSSVKITAN